MHTAEDLLSFFDTVTDNPTAAVRALRRERVDGGFEAVEDVPLSAG